MVYVSYAHLCVAVAIASALARSLVARPSVVTITTSHTTYNSQRIIGSAVVIAAMVESYKRRRRRRAALPSSSLLPFVVLLLVVGALLTGIPSCNAQRAAVGGIGARIKKIVPGRRSEALHSQLVPDGESMIDNSSAHPTVMLLATMMVAFVISYLAAEMNGARERSRSVLSKIAGK